MNAACAATQLLAAEFPAHPLFKLPANLAGVAFTDDLQRTLVVVPTGDATPAPIDVVMGWSAGLAKR